MLDFLVPLHCLERITLEGFEEDERWEEEKSLPQVKRLDLANCQNVETLHGLLQYLPGLEMLCIEKCQLHCLGEVLPPLPSLKVLFVSQCPEFYLPDNVGSLEQLEELTLVHYVGSRLPVSLHRLPKLRILAVRGGPLKCLPQEIGHMASLVDLRLWQIHDFEELPSTVGMLSNLTRLELFDMPMLKGLPCSFKSFPHLRLVGIEECPRLEESTSYEEMLPIAPLTMNEIYKLADDTQRGPQAGPFF